MDSIRHINYKSDFIVRERFRDAAGAFVAIPAEVDFELRYWVKPGRQFIASRVGGEFINLVIEIIAYGCLKFIFAVLHIGI